MYLHALLRDVTSENHATTVTAGTAISPRSASAALRTRSTVSAPMCTIKQVVHSIFAARTGRAIRPLHSITTILTVLARKQDIQNICHI